MFRLFGFPSSVAIGGERQRLRRPSRCGSSGLRRDSAGALLPTMSGVVLSAPPAPMLDMMTVSSST